MGPHFNSFVRLIPLHRPQTAVGRKIRPWVKRTLELEDEQLLSELPEGAVDRVELRSICRDKSISTEASVLAVMAWGAMRADHLRFLWDDRKKWIRGVERLRSSPDMTREESFTLMSRLRSEGSLMGARAPYFTKLIFFLRAEMDGYIMDQWTAKSVNLISEDRIVPLSSYGYVDDNADAAHYQAFCQFIERIAGLTGKSAEKVEELMMSHGGRTKGAWRQYVIDNWRP